MHNKWEYKFASEQPKLWGAATRSVFEFLISLKFVKALEKLTGIDNLIADAPNLVPSPLVHLRAGADELSYMLSDTC